MSSTTSEPSVSVDAGALGNAVFQDAAEALALTVVLTIDWLEEEDNPLNQTQKVALARAAFLHAGNLEASMTRTIVDELERVGVDVRGLPRDMSRLLGRKNDDA